VNSGGAQAITGGSRGLGDANGTPIIVDSANVRRVSIGTFTITAGGVPAQTTMFQLADRPDRDDTLTWTNGTILDSLIAPTTFDVVTTPEPSAALALAAVAAGASLTHRGKRRRSH
jgi:MYXO-CTERM domain-containing protein